jgi:uracil-DNA glycosylase family 4
MPRDLLAKLSRDIVACAACPRLVAFREEVARRKRRAYLASRYWGRPVPGFGDRHAPIVLIGLAPGAHGANRTGRVFTGDRSGDFLFAALHRAGLANQPTSKSADDGLVLRGIYVLLAARCVPPGNSPNPDELARCAPFLDAELDLLGDKRVVLALGAVAFDAYLGYLSRHGRAFPRPRPRFAHGAELEVDAPSPRLVGSYHVSQQNTQTGRLTPAMFDAVLERVRKLAGA